MFQPAMFQPAVCQPAVFQPAMFQPAMFQPAVFQPAVFLPQLERLMGANLTRLLFSAIATWAGPFRRGPKSKRPGRAEA